MIIVTRALSSMAVGPYTLESIKWLANIYSNETEPKLYISFNFLPSTKQKMLIFLSLRTVLFVELG